MRQATSLCCYLPSHLRWCHAVEVEWGVELGEDGLFHLSERLSVEVWLYRNAQVVGHPGRQLLLAGRCQPIRVDDLE